MSLFTFDDGGGINPLDGPNTVAWTVLDLNRACIAHARVLGAERTRSIFLEITHAPITDIVHIKREHRGALIARFAREIAKRPHQATAHEGQPK